MIRAVTFDLWGTIFNYSEAIVARRLSLLSDKLKRQGSDPDAENLKDAYIRTQDLFEDSWERAKRSFSSRERIEAILNRLGASLIPAELEELVREIEEAVLSEAPDLVDGVEKAIVSLSPNYKLGIISDTGMTPGRVLRPLLEKVGLLSHFSFSLFSDEVGYYKPHAEIFRRALRELAVPPEQAVHIGDRPETDIKGAKGVGMKAILFSPSGSSEIDIGQADAVIEDYHRLKEVVETL